MSEKLIVNSNLNTVGGDLDDMRSEIMQPEVFKLLRLCGWRTVPWKRYVVLSFDIISLKVLSPDLTPKDLQELPPFVMFFAIQIVNTKIVQPIGKVFLKESTRPELVATCIASFIRDLMRCEYFVVATVSRPILFFQNVLNYLVKINSTKEKTGAYLYKIEHLKIVHLYDPINMLENIFILFLKYAIAFTKNKVNFFAIYDDCKTVMIHSTARDVVNYIFNNTNNITCAIRLFSMTFYREIQECICKGKLTNIGSAEFCAFFDTLFDSIHGNMNDSTLKINRGPITKISPHYKIWNKSLAILRSMRIVDVSGANIPVKDVNTINFKINDDYGYYEILNTISQVETESVTEIEKSMNEILEKIKEIKLEDGEHLLDQQNLKTVEIKYYDNDIDGTQNSNISDKKDSANLSYVDGFRLTIQSEDFSTELEDDNDECITLTSEDGSNDTLENYLKKLYVTLRNSECSDVKINNDANGVSNNSLYLQQKSNNWKVCIDTYDDILGKQNTETFSIQHFDINLYYLHYFVNNNCMPKKNTYNKVGNSRENLIKKPSFNEADYIDEREITYTKEAIVSGDSYKEHDNIEYDNFNLDYKTNQKDVNKSIINENCKCKKSLNIKNFQTASKHSIRTQLNTAVVENILVALEYIRTKLESAHDNEQILKQILNYLIICEVIESDAIVGAKLEDCICIINKSLQVMMVVLSNNKPNDSEKDIASINLTIIRQRMRELKQDHGNTQENSEKASVSDIPDFFSSTTVYRSKERNANVGKVSTNINKITNKILPKHSTTTNEKIGNVKNIKQCEEHADLEKIRANLNEAYPEINKIRRIFDGEGKMEVCSDDNLSTDEIIDESCSGDNSQPYIFNAWRVTINGMKKVYEFLQTRRFQMLHTDSFNIDYIRHTINDIRKNHGEDIENTHQISNTLICEKAKPLVFETFGTIILE